MIDKLTYESNFNRTQLNYFKEIITNYNNYYVFIVLLIDFDGGDSKAFNFRKKSLESSAREHIFSAQAIAQLHVHSFVLHSILQWTGKPIRLAEGRMQRTVVNYMESQLNRNDYLDYTDFM